MKRTFGIARCLVVVIAAAGAAAALRAQAPARADACFIVVDVTKAYGHRPRGIPGHFRDLGGIWVRAHGATHFRKFQFRARERAALGKRQ